MRDPPSSSLPLFVVPVFENAETRNGGAAELLPARQVPPGGSCRWLRNPRRRSKRWKTHSVRSETKRIPKRQGRKKKKGTYLLSLLLCYCKKQRLEVVCWKMSFIWPFDVFGCVEGNSSILRSLLNLMLHRNLLLKSRNTFFGCARIHQ